GGVRVMTSTLVAIEPGGGDALHPVSLDDLDAAARAAPEIAAMSTIRQAYAPSFSPDAKAMAFVSDRTGVPQVWTANADGSAARAVTTFEDPVGWVEWSPDGAWLAVSV